MSCEAVIRSYFIHDHLRSEEELHWFASQPSLQQATVVAALAKDTEAAKLVLVPATLWSSHTRAAAPVSRSFPSFLGAQAPSPRPNSRRIRPCHYQKPVPEYWK
jgi:hypothetical protein